MIEHREDGRSARARVKRQARREQILHAAERVIGRRGYQMTSVADILAEAGISRGTFYHYFDSRDALFQELIDRFTTTLMRTIKVVRREDGDPGELLLANIFRVLEVLRENRDMTTVLLREAVYLDAEVDRKVSAFYEFLRQMIVGALANGARWKITRNVDNELVATAVVGAMKELIQHYLVLRPEEAFDTRAISRALFEFGYLGLILRE